ncbi:MAG: cytochrome c peroxidase, partial [Bacteroidota bacterium]
VHQEQEFRTSYSKIIEKLSASPEYIELFQRCFPNQKELDSTQINQALEAYMATLVSFDAPLDRFMRKEQTLDSKIIEGYNLFMGKAECGICHKAPLFSGMNTIFLAQDQHYSCDEYGKVKTPTVRNLQFTMPYLRHGTINTQEELFENIFNSVKQNAHPNNLLTKTEQDKIINFLGSLNDESTVKFDVPEKLPKMIRTLNKIKRRAGGVY